MFDRGSLQPVVLLGLIAGAVVALALEAWIEMRRVAPREDPVRSRRHRLAWWLSLPSVVVPALSSLVLLLLFGAARLHPTAQLSGGIGPLFSLWVAIWPMLLLASLLALLCLLASLPIHLQPRATLALFLMRVAGAVAVVGAAMTVLLNFPSV